MSIIDFQKVSFQYQSESTIKNISFSVEKGEFVAVVGANGAGKSTVSKLCGGLLKPASGSVTVCGLDTRTTRASALARYVGFLFQNPDRQLCQPTVREEILFSLRCTGIAEEKRESLVAQTLRAFDLQADAAPFSLSRGQRQRVALASLIAARPAVLILDEPTTGLDYRECVQIMELVKGLCAGGVTVLMVCHDMEVVLDYAQRMLVMAGGEVIGGGEPRKVFKDSALLDRASLLPPQIAQLAGRFAEPAFQNVFTVDEMVSAVRKERAQ